MIPPQLLAATDSDPLQIAMVVIFVVAGFIKWLWDSWVTRKGESTDADELSPQEQQLRDEAWRQQTGQSVPQSRPSSNPPTVSPTPWDELRKAWNELKETARPGGPPEKARSKTFPQDRRPAESAPVTPPPIPPRRGSVRAELSQKVAKNAAIEAAQLPPGESPPVPEVTKPMAILKAETPSPFLVALQGLRTNPTLMRQAIIVQEVLGPPKALQSCTDPAI